MVNPFRFCMVDAGCTNTLVRSDFVSIENANRQSQVKARCCHGDVRSYPTEKVQVTIDGKVYQVEASLLSQLPQPVLLGRDVSSLPQLVQKEVTACTVLTKVRRKAVEEE